MPTHALNLSKDLMIGEYKGENLSFSIAIKLNFKGLLGNGTREKKTHTLMFFNTCFNAAYSHDTTASLPKSKTQFVKKNVVDFCF